MKFSLGNWRTGRDFQKSRKKKMQIQQKEVGKEDRNLLSFNEIVCENFKVNKEITANIDFPGINKVKAICCSLFSD